MIYSHNLIGQHKFEVEFEFEKAAAVGLRAKARLQYYSSVLLTACEVKSSATPLVGPCVIQSWTAIRQHIRLGRVREFRSPGQCEWATENTISLAQAAM